jgi:hypothetical protein
VNRPVPKYLFRAHGSDTTALQPSTHSGAFRWDDPRPHDAKRFHVLYTADSITGALIEKLQVQTASDAEALAILDSIADDEPDGIEVQRHEVPESTISRIVITTLHVLNTNAQVVDPFDVSTLALLQTVLFPQTEPLPITRKSRLKSGDLLGIGYKIPQRISQYFYDTRPDAVGIVSRSSLDNPLDTIMHVNYNLWRETPQNGSALRLALAAENTAAVTSSYVGELKAALQHLGSQSSMPLNDIT